VPGPDGVGSVVTVGGLTRTDASGGFEDEFANLAVDIADASSPSSPPSPSSPTAGPAASADHQKPEPNNQSETGA
jgi:hypothetical protein